MRPGQPPSFDLPEGFPPEMMLYDRWAEERGWPPEVVRRLRRQELFWLPVIASAKRDASEQLAAIEQAKRKS